MSPVMQVELGCLYLRELNTCRLLTCICRMRAAPRWMPDTGAPGQQATEFSAAQQYLLRGGFPSGDIQVGQFCFQTLALRKPCISHLFVVVRQVQAAELHAGGLCGARLGTAARDARRGAHSLLHRMRSLSKKRQCHGPLILAYSRKQGCSV